jgi:hypothetical protein
MLSGNLQQSAYNRLGANMPSAISLSAKVLSWIPSRQSSSIADDPDWKTPYRYWKHAEDLLAHPDNEHFRIDCIGNLKRAIDHRLKRLNTLYRFKRIPDLSMPTELLGALGYFGIARPTMNHTGFRGGSTL